LRGCAHLNYLVNNLEDFRAFKNFFPDLTKAPYLETLTIFDRLNDKEYEPTEEDLTLSAEQKHAFSAPIKISLNGGGSELLSKFVASL